MFPGVRRPSLHLPPSLAASCIGGGEGRKGRGGELCRPRGGGGGAGEWGGGGEALPIKYLKLKLKLGGGEVLPIEYIKLKLNLEVGRPYQ